MKRSRSGLILLAVVLLVGGCALKKQRQSNQYPPIRVRIENQNFYDATVYLLWRGDRRRLGVVGGNSRVTFNSAWYGPAIQVEVNLLAGQRFRSEEWSVSPGEQVIVEIPPNVNRIGLIRRGL